MISHQVFRTIAQASVGGRRGRVYLAQNAGKGVRIPFHVSHDILELSLRETFESFDVVFVGDGVYWNVDDCTTNFIRNTGIVACVEEL